MRGEKSNGYHRQNVVDAAQGMSETMFKAVAIADYDMGWCGA
jgi:hypothetical protein